jgi:hypothetical protein
LISMCWIGSAFADDVHPPVSFYKEFTEGDFKTLPFAMLHCFAVTVIVEYLVVYLLLRRSVKDWKRLFFWVLVVNLITNPAAVLGSLFVGDPVIFGSEILADSLLYIIEFLVVAVEFVFLRWAFGQMYRQGILDKPITAKRTLIISILANLASFFIGWLVFFFILVVGNPDYHSGAAIWQYRTMISGLTYIKCVA